MTFLTTRYTLQRELTPVELSRLGGISTHYGIRGVSIQENELIVEYDASRMHEAEVLGVIRQSGIPAAPPRAIPAGGFDYTGEFRDFAWPIEGLSPANQKS